MVHPATASDPFIRRVDALLSDPQYPEFDIRQRLQLHFQGSHITLSDGEVIDMHKIDQIPVNRILGWLPLLTKINIIFMQKDVAEGHKALLPSVEVPSSPMPSLSDSECAEAKDFRQEIETEIDGVVTIYELDALRILRMRLFAALGKCLQRDENLLNIAIKKQSNQDQPTDSTVRKELGIVRTSLIQMFGYIRNYAPEYLSEAAIKTKDILNIVAALPETWKHKQESSDKHKLGQCVEDIQQMLTTLHRALQKPYVLFPYLLNRIKSVPKISCPLPVDREAIDISARDWLHDAVASWEIESDTFLPLFKEINEEPENRQKAQTLEESRKRLIREAKQTVNPAIARALQELPDFEQLPADRQLDGLAGLDQLKNSCESVGDDFEAFSQRMQQFTKNVKKLIQTNRGELPENAIFPHYSHDADVQLPIKVEEEIDTPQYCYFRVASAIIESIKARCSLYKRFYKLIDQVMTPTYKHLSGVPLVDLLQWQMRAHYDSVAEKLPTQQKERLEQHQVRTDLLFAHTRQLLTAQHLDSGVESFEHFEWTSRASEIARDAHGDLKLAPDHVKPLLNHYVGLGDVLGHFLLFRKAHQMLTRNPYQRAHAPELEEKFYCALFGMIRKMFLSQNSATLTAMMEPLLQDASIAQEKPFFAQVKDLLKAYQGLSQLQEKLRQQNPPDQKTFKQQARQFLDHLTAKTKELDERTEEIGLALSLYLTEAHESSPNIRQIAEALPHLQELLQQFIFSPAQRLISYLAIDEIITEEKAEAASRQKRAAERIERKKAKAKVPVKKAETDSATPPAATQPPPPPEALSLLQTSFQQLEQRYRSLLQGQTSEIAKTLLDNLLLIKNLCATVDGHGGRPSFILECGLAMTVHLEQTLTLLQNPGISKSIKSNTQELLKSMGMEYRWSQHAPHLLLPPVPLAEPIRKYLEERQKVIAVSSRYPATGRDPLSISTLNACTLEKPGKSQAAIQLVRKHYASKTKDNLQAGLETSIALLNAFGPAPSSAPMEEPLSPSELETTLAPAIHSEIDVASTSATLHRFETLLGRIQKFRAVSLYREVEGNRNCLQRKGTIQQALQELQMLPLLCRDLLLAPDATSQGLIQAKQAWLRQAVLLESALLIILSHLPASLPHSQAHCLWEEPHPARYSHQLVSLTQLLRAFAKLSPVSFPAPLMDETEEIAKEAEPCLKKLYRYHVKDPSPAKVRLEKMRNLMRLRAQLHEGLEPNTQDQLDRLLNVSSASQRAARLDAHILDVLKSEAKIPLLETLEVVEEWLSIYERLLIQTSAKSS
ncbi:MAG: hypothetical protein LLG04_15850 [Parachlamydia sp.]|nr:hypothetical protein [Parachlamydia sp.]